MLKFTEFITEDMQVSSLTIWDIDDTLFRTTTKVFVVKGDRRVRTLTPAEFNVYKLKSGEEFDFSEFRSAEVFNATARPVDTVFKTAKKMLSKFRDSPQKKIIIITARADLDDKKLFLATFKKYGFDINRVHVERAGNRSIPGPAAKAQIASEYLQKGNYTVARMFDDAVKNLQSFLALKKEFPKVNFEAFLIHENGSITRYGG